VIVTRAVLGEGAFNIYSKDDLLEVAGTTSCGDCSSGNIEYTPEEMIKNGATAIHFATGFLVGYPPCPYITEFKTFIEAKYEILVIDGTQSIPEKYIFTHKELNTWGTVKWQELIA